MIVFKVQLLDVREEAVMSNNISTYDEEALVKKFKLKQDQCKERLIPFEFTLDQWFDFHKLLYSGIHCAYTNCEFVFEKGHDHYPTIERLSDTQGYSVYNCVWVTSRANKIKDEVSKGKSSIEFSSGLQNFAKRIEKIVENKELIKIIQEPYTFLFKEKSDLINENRTHNNEIEIAKRYSMFGKYVENRCKLEFSLTYTGFKRLTLRKKCMLTHRPLPENIDNKGYYILDKSKPVNKDNILVTSKNLQESMDKLSSENNLTYKELCLLYKNITK